MNCNKVKRIGAGALAFAILAVSAPIALAQETETVQQDARFCKNLPQLISVIEQRDESAQSGVLAKLEELGDQVEIKRAGRKERVLERRSNHDDAIAAMYERLREVAETQKQEDGVAEFQNAVDAAVAEYRTSVDATIDTFYNDLNTAFKSRTVAISSAITDFVDTRDAAIAKAQTDCDSGVEPPTVRANLIAEIQDARDDFRSAMQEIKGDGSVAQELKDTLTSSVEQARQTLNEKLTAAKEGLKPAFGE